ncbi:MAG TPA: ADP-ribosylglycohydrolase family protein [Acidimicrobiia bacterium]|nr:ADP-ribosylglycohydrolase family protein [Acidimicrobiia bacterium]
MKAAVTAKSRVLGSLMGGAVGDALGLPVEFSSIDEIHRRFGPSGVVGYPANSSYPAAFSDDTQMTLWTAEGLIRSRQRERRLGPDHKDLARTVNGSYLRWFLTQRSGVPPSDPATAGEPLESGWLIGESGLWLRVAPGNTCLSALRVGGLGTREDPINDSKGCGGVMRVAPVGLMGLADEQSYQLGCDLAALTHGHPAGYVAAGALALMINRLWQGDDLESAVDMVLQRIDADQPGGGVCAGVLRRAVSLAEAEAPSHRVVERIGGGWVAEEALAIGVYSALVAGDFRDGMLLSVNHSGDSDSTGSIAGQIMGALLGLEAIPTEWLDGLGLRTVVERVAGDLHDAYHEDREFPLEDYPAW